MPASPATRALVADGTADSSRPRGLGPCDLLSADELAALLGCRKSTAIDWAEARNLGLPTPGRGIRYNAGEVLQALRDDRERAKSPRPKPVPLSVDLPLADITPHRGGPKGRRPSAAR